MSHAYVDEYIVTTEPSFEIAPPPVTRRVQILLVEDDDQTACEIESDLIQRGYDLSVARNGRDGLEAARAGKFDVMIIDRMLPELEGLSVIAALRDEQIKVPVLVLSALGAVDDRVVGLKAGGDDYLTKPFALVELAARIEALLRRPTDARETKLRVGSLLLDLIDRTAFRGDLEIELLPREFKILEYMMRRVGKIVTRDMLLEDVWNYRFLPQTNLVDVHIGKLRKKIDLPGQIPLIKGVRGAGFMITPDIPEI